jgi:hypothetical protein
METIAIIKPDPTIFFVYELSIELNKTSVKDLNNKIISKEFTIEKNKINKIFENQFVFGSSKKMDLSYIDYLIQGFKEKISEFVENEILKKDKYIDLIISDINIFEKWLIDSEIKVKELN